MKIEERRRARELRGQRGLSMKAIAAELGVALSSVSRWVADIELTPLQTARLQDANPVFARQRAGTANNAQRRRAERRRAQEHGRALARRGDPLHRAGCMLFWAEGSKARNRVVFTNADVDMVRLFLTFLRTCYRVPDERVRLTCNCHLGNGLSLGAIERWWLRQLDLPEACLRRSIVNRASVASQHKRRTLPLGTVNLTVGSTAVVQSIYGAIQEYAGIERPEWLDCARGFPEASP
jgi:transposase-like protein